MTLEAILFGGIGAISECADLDRAAWNSAFRAHGLDWEWSWDTYQRLVSTRGERSPVARYAVQLGCAVNVEAVERSQSRLFAAMLAEGLPLRPGVAGVVKAAAGRGLKLGLVSRSDTEPVRALLKATARARGGVGFDVAILRDDLMHLPPHPEAYNLALAQVGVLPSVALAVVDSAAAMQAAAAAGIGTLGFPGALARTGGLGVPGRAGEVAVLSISEVDAAWRRSLRQAAE
ncbi:HAD family hydrolase [Nioella aestuarii]|uniref:HAD family hydrolase n=1 Tax=Nioella aestuarii TaxID=1662864 RepID=UPI003D7FADF5